MHYVYYVHRTPKSEVSLQSVPLIYLYWNLFHPLLGPHITNPRIESTPASPSPTLQRSHALACAWSRSAKAPSRNHDTTHADVAKAKSTRRSILAKAKVTGYCTLLRDCPVCKRGRAGGGGGLHNGEVLESVAFYCKLAVCPPSSKQQLEYSILREIVTFTQIHTALVQKPFTCLDPDGATYLSISNHQ